ncbi:MAG: hypothetical protein PF505_09480 [Vallitaleaceae bacterium]|jgi:hypothetical protein|nr:hypothetical protein [Vallitaleaceae bacterium]
MADISNSIRYWIKAYKNPTLMMGIITKKVNKVGIIFRINILMALLMVMTSLLNYVLSIEPYTGSVLQLLPDQPNSYYLVQAIYTIPWTILMWIMIAGVIYLVSIMGKSASRRFFFDDALVIATFGWVLPWLILIWIPETLIYIQ